MANLTFLGTGGGRFVMTSQARATGGFILELDRVIFHVDPGPGALVMAKQFGVDLSKVDVLMLSHEHLDHTGDASAVIECMTRGAKQQSGTLLANESVIKCPEPTIKKYLLKILERVVPMKVGDEVYCSNVRVKSTPTQHGEKCMGFMWKGSKQISYVCDTELFEALPKHHIGSEILILNVLRPRSEKWPGHVNTLDAVEIIKAVKPKLAIMQHFGMKMLKAVPEKEAKFVEKETGIPVIAATDGMKIDLDASQTKSLQRFVK